MTPCPCGSQKNYLTCCGLYIENQAKAKTPEALMRSRYTAYTQARIDYIKNTMQGTPLEGFNEIEATRFAKQANWTGLQVIKSYMDKANENLGYVEFIASYLEQGKPANIHELSEFQRHNDTWFYTNSLEPKGRTIKKLKISRNGPCHCGSQKKYKNCHGLNKAR